MSAQDFLAKFSTDKLQRIYDDPQAAFYLVDKPKNLHSFKIVATLRNLLGLKKVGFSGTLDPLATGLMILATGRATRLLDLFHQLPKTYLADIIFGQTSASYDLEKDLVIDPQAKSFSQENLVEVLKSFLGKQEQEVPIFSAKKVGGQKLNKLARVGQTNIILPKNKIEIYDLEIIKFAYPNLRLKVGCSAGTYIRSLVNDLGQMMKTGAVLADLRRSKIGPWSVEQALDFSKVDLAQLQASRLKPQEIISALVE